MSNENSSNRPQMTTGKYRVRALDAGFTEAGTGTEQIAVQLEVVDGEFKGSLMTWYGAFTEAAEERTVQSMRYLGWKGVDINDLSTMFAGQEAQADVVVEETQDGRRVKVEWINGVGLVLKKKIEGAQLAGLAKRIRGVAARVGGAAAQQGGGNNGLPPNPRTNGGNGGNNRRDDEPPPPDDRDAPPWGGRGGGNNRGGNSGRSSGRW